MTNEVTEMTNEQKVSSLLNPRLREIHANIGGATRCAAIR